jgi:uncharacterized membrane protein YphA (DoxX/SURF4 family)
LYRDGTVPVSIDLSSSFRSVLPELVAVFFFFGSFFGSADLPVPVSVVVDAGLSAGAVAVVAAGLSAGGGVVVAAGTAADPAAAAGAAVVVVPLSGAFWASAMPAWKDTITIAAARK